MSAKLQKVLIVDDIDFTREVACKIVGLCGYEAIDAASKDEAMNYFREETPDLVIADVLMADEQGFETIQEIREIDDETPIIALGAPADPLLMSLAHGLGAQSALQKPFGREVLMAEIRKYM